MWGAATPPSASAAALRPPFPPASLALDAGGFSSSNLSPCPFEKPLPSGYDPARRMLRLCARSFCSGAARHVTVPREAVAVTYARSSGPGGQNVNKVSTKASLRVDVSEAASWWLPTDVRHRLVEQHRSAITKSGELLLSCDDTRSQSRNLSIGLERLQKMVDDACVVPKTYVDRRDLDEPEGLRRDRVRKKRQHSLKKQQRRSGRPDFG